MTTDAKQLSLALTAPFPADAVHWKPLSVKGNRALAAAYLDARAVMQRLDCVFGVGGWKDAYQLVAGGSVVCTLSVKVDGEWIDKTDVGSPSRTAGRRRQAESRVQRCPPAWHSKRPYAAEQEPWR